MKLFFLNYWSSLLHRWESSMPNFTPYGMSWIHHFNNCASFFSKSFVSFRLFEWVMINLNISFSFLQNHFHFTRVNKYQKVKDDSKYRENLSICALETVENERIIMGQTCSKKIKGQTKSSSLTKLWSNFTTSQAHKGNPGSTQSSSLTSMEEFNPPLVSLSGLLP